MRKTVFSALVAIAVLSPAAVVTAQSADAGAMAQRIGGRLKESGQLRDYRVGVKYIDGIACLTGTVTSPEQAEAAVRLTRQVEGVRHVVNDLTISGDSLQPASYQQRSRAPEPQQFPRPPAAPMSSSRRPANGNWNQNAAGPADGRMTARQMPQQPAMRATAGNRPSPGQLGPRTQQPNNMNNMPRPANMAAGRQPARQQPNPMAQQAMAQQAMAQRAMAQQAMGQQSMAQRPQRPMPANYMAGQRGMQMPGGPGGGGMGPMPTGQVPGGNVRAASYDNAQMPGYAWPSYAAYPNYAALSYPQQYSPTAWPYIGPFYPYPQVPLGWRKVALEWDDGWWFLDFSDRHAAH